MQPFILISVFALGAILIGLLIVVIISNQKSSTETDLTDDETRPQGYWISVGISIGAGFGVALGLVFDNLALGIALGAGIGVAIGAALEQRNKNRTRPLTVQEQRLQKWGISLGLLMLLVFVGIFVLIQLLRIK